MFRLSCGGYTGLMKQLALHFLNMMTLQKHASWKHGHFSVYLLVTVEMKILLLVVSIVFVVFGRNHKYYLSLNSGIEYCTAAKFCLFI